jgi:hypothetical protein
MGKVVSSIANVFTGADDTRAAGERAAAQQSQAARDASAAAAFRPVGMTTRFGSSQFTRSTDPATGMPYISSAGYTSAPELAALQNQLFGEFGGGYGYAQQQGQQLGALAPAAQSLFGLGQQILPSQYNTAPSEQAQGLAAQYQQAMQGLLPSSYQSAVSPEAQAAAQQYQQFSGMLAPTTAQTGASPQAQAYAQQLQQYANQLAPASFQTGATPEAMQLAQQFRQTGQGYLAQSPEEARAEYMRTQQAVLAPGRAAEEARLATANFGRGTGGLGVQTGTGSAPSNPLAQALFNARGQQDLQLAAQAEQAAQQRQAFGLSNLGQGLTTQQQSEATQRANMLQNFGLSTQLAGTAYGTTATAEEVARQNMLQNLGLSADLTGRALGTQQLSQQTAEQNLLNRLGLGLGYGQQAYQTTATAEDLARQRAATDIGLGAGLFGTGAGLLGTQAAGMAGAYAPLQTQLGLAGQVEQMAQMPYQLGLQLGQAQQPGQTAGSQMFQQGMNQAAQTQYGATQAANAANAQFWGGLVGAAGTAAAGRR